MRKGADSRPTHISRGASARDWNFEWYVRFGSVSERAELRPDSVHLVEEFVWFEESVQLP